MAKAQQKAKAQVLGPLLVNKLGRRMQLGDEMMAKVSG